MFSYTKRNINIISLIISIIIFICFSYCNNFFQKIDFKSAFSFNNKDIEISQQYIEKQQEDNVENIEQVINNEEELKEEEIISTNDQVVNWTIKIPKIGLEANIAEGTTKDVMNEYVGHFEETSRDFGNIGLAAHNRRISSELFCTFEKIKDWR